MILRLLLFDDTSKQEHRARVAPKSKVVAMVTGGSRAGGTTSMSESSKSEPSKFVQSKQSIIYD